MKFFSNLFNASWEQKLIEESKKEGISEGRHGRPSPESVVPDVNENKYLNEARKLILKANNELNRQVTSLLPRLAAERNNLNNANTEIQNRPEIDTLRAEIVSTRDSFSHDLEGSNLKKITTEGYLNAFKQTHEVKHDPDHPKDIMNYMSVVFLLLAVESAFNAFFWSKGSGHGYVGGFAMAITLAIGNIALALFTGIGWRFKNLHGVSNKNISIFSLAVGFIAILTLNLYIVIKRNDIGLEAINQSNVSLIFQQTESITLLVLGLVCAVVAIFKGYKIFGSIPGYKKVTEDHDLAKFEVKDLEDKIKIGIKSTVDTALNKIKNINSTIASSMQKVSVISGAANILLKDFSAITKQIEHSYVQIIKSYRANNAASKPQGIGSPSYFGDPIVLEKPLTEQLDNLIIDSKELEKEIQGILQQLSEVLKREEIEINNLKAKSLAEELTDFLKERRESARKNFIALMPKII